MGKGNEKMTKMGWKKIRKMKELNTARSRRGGDRSDWVSINSRKKKDGKNRKENEEWL